MVMCEEALEVRFRTARSKFLVSLAVPAGSGGYEQP